jgi:cytochrome c biogenesis protein CcmG, thiol:disulfide interchange protein DsbE
MANATRRQPQKRSRLPLIIGAVAVVVIALIAVVASSGDDGSDGSVRSGGDSTAAGSETRPVVATGEPLPGLKAGEADPAVGRTVARIEGQSFDGNPLTVGAGVNAPQLVFVVAHWCPHCQKEVPVIVDWLKEKGAPAGVELRGVSTSVSEDRPNYPPSTWLAKEEWTIPTIADNEQEDAARALGVSGYPFFVAIDREGKVVARASGEKSVAEIERLVAQARGGA